MNYGFFPIVFYCHESTEQLLERPVVTTAPVELVITHFVDQIYMRYILQLTRDIQRVVQKLLKYLNVDNISESLELAAAKVLSVILALI